MIHSARIRAEAFGLWSGRTKFGRILRRVHARAEAYEAEVGAANEACGCSAAIDADYFAHLDVQRAAHAMHDVPAYTVAA